MNHEHDAFKVVTRPDGHLQGTCWICGCDFDFEHISEHDKDYLPEPVSNNY